MNNKTKKIIFFAIIIISMTFLSTYAKKHNQGNHNVWTHQT